MPRRPLLSALLVSLPLACSGADGPAELERLRVGVLPDQDRHALVEMYTPLLEHLSREVGLPCELVIADSYEQHVELFRSNEIDLGYFGGVTFVRAHLAADAIPLVSRDIDRNFTSILVVGAESPATDLADLQGQSFSFGSELSTSGHFMPRRFLSELGFDPESHFDRVSFSGSHDETARRVRDGVVDAGVLNSRVLPTMIADGRLEEGEVRVFWESPTFVDYVWALQTDIEEDLRARIRDAFLMLSADHAGHAGVLDSLDAKHFLPATPHDFLELGEILSESELAAAL